MMQLRRSQKLEVARVGSKPLPSHERDRLVLDEKAEKFDGFKETIKTVQKEVGLDLPQ